VTFRSHLDGAKLRAVAGARDRGAALLGSDIAMQLDECVRLPASAARSSARCSCRCAGPSAASARSSLRAPGLRHAVRHRPGRRRADLRGAPARGRWSRSAFDGYAIGGLAVGEPQAVMLAMIDGGRPDPAGRIGRAI
jgi:queuine tRNA-ribosyltransferase